MVLNTKTVAGPTGISVQTLKQARCNTRRSARHDIWAPQHVHIPKRKRPAVGYSLVEVLRWSQHRDRPLCWDDVPRSVVLPAVRAHEEAGLPLPAALAAGLGQAMALAQTRRAAH